MTLAAQAINVHPPRAKRWKKPAQVITRRHNILRESFNRVHDRVRSTGITDGLLTFDVVYRLLLPGWAQFYLGRPTRGFIFSISAAVGLLLALIFVGTTFGGLAFGLMFSMHAGSISDAVIPIEDRMLGRIVRGFAVYAVLGMFFYYPLIHLATHFVVPLAIQRDISPFIEGDVLLLHPTTRFRDGDVVIYDRGDRRMGGGYERGEHRYVVFGGRAIDRVLAGPGDHVVCQKNLLTINGKPSLFRPLNDVGIQNLDLIVPARSYFVWPSVAVGVAAGLSLDQVAIVPADTISGVVIFRTYPWPRAGFIR